MTIYENYWWNPPANKPKPKPKPKPGSGGDMCRVAQALIPARMRPAVARAWWTLGLPSPAPMARRLGW